MFIGTVVGTVVSTAKDPSLTGCQLLLVRRQENGEIVVAVDATRCAGQNSDVYVVTGKEGVFILDAGDVAADAGIAGIIDSTHIST